MAHHSTVAVIGLGYIGLPTAAILASNGVKVIGVDVSDRHVDAVNRGEVPFAEPDLATHVAGAVSQGMLSAQQDTPHAETYIVAVPTPFKDGYAADLSYIEAATDAIIPQLKGDELIILESTSPPGATEHMAERVLSARPDLSLDGSQGRPVVHFAHCPERVLPGRVLIELVTTDRIIGGLTTVRQGRHRRLRAHRAGQQAPPRRHPPAGPRRRRSLHRRRPVVHRQRRPGGGTPHPHRLRGQRPQAGVCPWQGRGPRRPLQGPGHRSSRPGVPARHRRPARVAGPGDHQAAGPAPSVLAGARHRAHVEEIPAALSVLNNVELASTAEGIAAADIVVLLVDHREFRNVDRKLLAERAVIDTRGLWR